MVKVKLMYNGNRAEVLVPTTYTIRQILEENHVDYSRGVTNLDGSTVSGNALDRPLSDFGVTGTCMLSNIVKTDNA